MTDVIVTVEPGAVSVVTESGPTGLSAYEVAVSAGFSGTEAEWLDSLHGADGGDETAAEILAKIVTVDGSGSGLDADTLDGSHATAFDVAGAGDAAVSAHVAAADPHTQYHTDARGDARYSQIGHTHAYDDLTGLPTLGTAAAEDVSAFDAAGTASAAVTAHESAIDPHPQYLTATEGAAAFDAAGAAASTVSSHAAATAGVHGISAFGATLVDDADAATVRATLGLGSAAVEDTGTGAGNLVQLDGAARLPAVDGSQLTNLPSSGSGDVPSGGATGQVLAKASGTDYDTEWVNQSGGAVTFTRGAAWANPDGVALPTNDVEIRFHADHTIVGVYIDTNGGTGSCVIDIQKSGVSICGASKPTISSGTSYSDTTLTVWTTSISAGDVLTIILESVSGVFEFVGVSVIIL